MYIILERQYDEYGEYVSNKEIYRGVERPDWELAQNQSIMKVTKLKQYDHRLAYPAAYGLSTRKGI